MCPVLIVRSADPVFPRCPVFPEHDMEEMSIARPDETYQKENTGHDPAMTALDQGIYPQFISDDTGPRWQHKLWFTRT